MQAFASSLSQRLLPVRIVVELFAGSCRWSKAAALAGEWVLSVDLRFGDHHDLSKVKLQRCVLGWIQAGWVRYVLAGFPCGSFSKARNIPGGPPALRDAANVAGFSDLRPADADKVHLGNLLLAFVCRLIRACRHARVPGIFENPWTSWAWAMPAMQRCLALPGVRHSRSDFCQWGMPWKKATGLLTLYCDPLRIECKCTGRGLCSRTRLPHIQLKGTCKGVFLTHLAEPYPRKLCRALVRMCVNAVLTLEAERLDKAFCRMSW